MSDPYETLGLESGSSEAEIRARYLELVRQYPPDRAPERFATIRAAYDELRDPVVRLQSQLFELRSEDSVDAILAEVERRMRTRRIPTQTLLSLAEPR